MQGKQPVGGRKRSRTDAPQRHVAITQTADRPSPPHKRDVASYVAHQHNVYMDAIWGDQMRQLCTEYDNQVHINHIPGAYQAMLAPPNPPIYERQQGKHVRFQSMPNAVPDISGAAMTLVGKAQSLWRQARGEPEDTYGRLPK